MSVENTDPVTGICDECVRRLSENHFLKSTGMWKDAAGVRHIIGGDFLQDYTACGIKDGSISEILP